MAVCQPAYNRDFIQKLRHQLDYIKSSCDDYDAGTTHEAIRIATALRIIFHDTGKSISLLTHLGQRDLKLLSVAEDIDRTNRFFAGLTVIELDPANLRQEFVPKLGRAAIKRSVSIDQWWQADIVFQDPNNKFTINRRDLVLAATNKDGGAHVDANLDPRYELIEQGAGWSMNVQPPNGSSIVVQATNGHLASLRQMGWEVLHSTDLLRFARKGK
jgi:hypothetical protein